MLAKQNSWPDDGEILSLLGAFLQLDSLLGVVVRGFRGGELDVLSLLRGLIGLRVQYTTSSLFDLPQIM